MVYLILILLIGALVLHMMGDQQSVIRFKTNYYKLKKYQARKKVEILGNEFNQEIKKAGLPFDLYKFQVARYSLTILFTFLILVQKDVSNNYLILMILFYALTIPKNKIYRIKTPVKMVIDKIIENRKKIYNNEVGLFVIIMNNNFNMYKETPPSAYKMVLEALVGTKKTKPIFEQLLRYWQTNKIEEGIEYFVNAIDTEESKKLGLLLSKLNDLHPIELKKQLITQKDIFRKKRYVEKKRKIKTQGYYVMAFVSGMLLFILLNITQGVIEINGGINL